MQQIEHINNISKQTGEQNASPTVENQVLHQYTHTLYTYTSDRIESQKHARRQLKDSPSSPKYSDHPPCLGDIDIPVTHTCGMGLSSRVPCQHTTLKQGSTTE